MSFNKKIAAVSLLLFAATIAHAQNVVSFTHQPGDFSIVSKGHPATIYTDRNDYWLVQQVSRWLQADVAAVTGAQPDTSHQVNQLPDGAILIGTIGHSAPIDQLIAEKKLDVSQVAGKWETFRIQVVSSGQKNILVIAGSDKRGAAFGALELSEQMGVSPWYWWADVPVRQRKEVYIAKGAHLFGPPSVKYRGIFINDEAPAFSGWTKEKFNGVNHLVYEKIFELLLRMKANYLWPAMWGNAFNDDDTLNPVMADRYGIVMGTSHHEPMLRAQQEWKRYGNNIWNYETNAPALRAFWTTGIEHMRNHESIVTIGMRGDGDKPMTQGSNVELLEKIVADQRKILADVTGKDPSATPQLWALYKEVQDYYDKGMRVPPDVTLLLCDDNWGNVRRLPSLADKKRPGGYGIYYHFDYVGGPRNYKWLNTNSIPRTWEQMHLAYQYGVDRIWIVNVGDLKPMELPISFFLDYAWDTHKWNAGNIGSYTTQWAARQFGEKESAAIGHILSAYTQINARRKPELLSPDTYSLVNYNEANRAVEEYAALNKQAAAIGARLPAGYHDAFYELVQHPVEACSNLNAMYVAAAKNKWYAAQGRSMTNELADSVKQYFKKDEEISQYYNTQLAGGKWDHMMDQTHIGYTYWQQPPNNTMPAVKTISISSGARMGVAIEGSTASWPNDTAVAVLPEFSEYGRRVHYIDVFNRGTEPFKYEVSSSASWLHISAPTGMVAKENRILLTVDWKNAPMGIKQVPVTVSGPAGKVVVQANIRHLGNGSAAFGEADKTVSMDAAHYTRAIGGNDIHWDVVPEIGRNSSGVALFPVTVSPVVPGGSSPRLEYQVYLSDTGMAKLYAYLSPTLDFNGGEGLHYGISIDDEAPQIISIHSDKSNRAWEQSVADEIRKPLSQHHITKAGIHTVRFWAVDPGVVLQKLVLDMGGVKPSYLGPPETSRMASAD